MELSPAAASEILESIADAFLVLDGDACFTYLNRQAEELFECRREDLVGRSAWEAFPESQGSRLQREWQQIMAGRQPMEFEEFCPRREAWLELRACPFAGGVTVSCRDVTERRNAEDAQRALVALVSHDLRNPLFLVKGTVEIVREQVRHGQLGRLDGDLQRIGRATGQMDRVVDDLMDLIQLQSGHDLVLDQAPVDLVALARRAAEVHQFSTDVHHVTFNTELEALVGRWDERRLERVLANLLTNAIKYSPAGRDVTVTVSEDRSDGGRWALVAVADQGMGISPVDLPRIFDRFYRAGAVAGVVPGAGVGLTSVRHTVEQHGGRIEVQSELGQGATFSIFLPLPALAGG